VQLLRVLEETDAGPIRVSAAFPNRRVVSEPATVE
jgi:hypothetical protein